MRKSNDDEIEDEDYDLRRYKMIENNEELLHIETVSMEEIKVKVSFIDGILFLDKYIHTNCISKIFRIE